MTVVAVSADGMESLTFAKTAGWVVRSFDWRPGAHREVWIDAPDAHGSIDTTALAGSGTLTLGLRMMPFVADVWHLHDELVRFARPDLRPVVTVDREDGSSVRRLITSRMTVSSTVERPTHRDAVVQCVAPFGAWESAELSTAVIFPGMSEGTGGMELPTELPVEFVSAGPPGSADITNLGTFDAYPILRVVGPCEGPIIENRTVGRSLVFNTAFAVEAGEYLEIDTRNKTIRLNGLVSQSRYDELDFAESAWWSLVPGVNDIRFTPAVFTAPSQLQILYRSAWL